MGKTLTNVSLLKQRVVRGSIDYFLRGSTTSSDDMIAVPVEDSTGNLVLWLRWAPPRKNSAYFRQCAWRNELHLAPPKQVFRTEPAPAAPGEKADDTSSGKELPPAKRVAHEQRAIPKGVTRDPVPADGNCLFHGAARILTNLRGDGKIVDAATLRAEVATHMLKHKERYIKEWDNEMPDKSIARQSLRCRD